MKGRSEMKVIIETDKKTIPALEAFLEYKGGYICGFAQDAADVDKILRKLKGESGGKDCGAEYAPDPEKPAEGVEAGKKAPEWEKDDYVWAVVKVCPKDDEKRKVVFARAKIENVVYVRNETRESRAVYTLTSPWGLLERENVFTTMQECEAFIDGFGFANIENAIR